MTINRDQLIGLIADELQITQVGQALSPEDSEKIDERITPTLTNLSKRGIIYLSNTDEFPDEVGDPLSVLIAQKCAPSFGKPRDENVVKMKEDELAVIQKRSVPTSNYLTSDLALQGVPLGYSESRWSRGI